MEKEEKNQLQIEITDDVVDGIYSNLAVITHSPTEFIIDFINMMPGARKARVKSRVVMTPAHAKRLYKALAENISRYEAKFGTIKDVDQPFPPYPMAGPAAEA